MQMTTNSTGLFMAAICGLFAMGLLNLSANPEKASVEMPEKHFALLENYCLDCHDSETAKGQVNLEDLSFNVAKDIQTAETWQHVLNVINSGEMPPEKKPQLEDAEKSAFLTDLSENMVTARKVLSDSGGVITLRRLNRREYANTIEDLLGVPPDLSNLPDDQATTAGFDTDGASLFFSSDQLEQYLTTARAALKLALLPRPKPKPQTRRVEPEEFFTPHYAAAAADLADQQIRAGKYFAQSEKPPSAFGFLDEYQVKKQRVAEWLPQLEKYAERPETKDGATLIMTIKQGGTTKIRMPVLAAHAEGNYTIRVRTAAYPDAAERFHYLEFTEGYGAGRALLGWRKITGTLEDPQIVEFPIRHQPGRKSQIWIHQRTHQDRGDKDLATIDMTKNGIGTPPGLWVDWAEITGPTPIDGFDEARQRLLFKRPQGWDDLQYGKEVIRRFATRAFRTSKPDEAYLERLFQQFSANLSGNRPVSEALVGPLAIVLSSPNFLYLMESNGEEDSKALTDTELAVRLSYFLWSAPPDAILMAEARNGTLSKPAVLKAQTQRLLSDQRADRFVEGFVHQWLELERLDTFQFNGAQFPTFDNAVRANAREEIFQMFHTLLADRLPIGTLLQSDFVVVNDLLAGYYGIPGVEGHEFRKVPVPPDSKRGGLLGTAAILAMGSDGQRSSPVERGAWVLRHLLHNPPPPAPPNVPQLGRLAGQALPARELIRAHTEEAQCIQCHKKIDPIGFGLENFDAAGLWRDLETVTTSRKGKRKRVKKTFPIEPAGKLPGGKAFADYFELRSSVAEHDDDFARGFTEALIAYGLGRSFGFTDQDLADEILKAARSGNNEPSQFIHAFVQSDAFKNK